MGIFGYHDIGSASFGCGAVWMEWSMELGRVNARLMATAHSLMVVFLGEAKMALII